MSKDYHGYKPKFVDTKKQKCFRCDGTGIYTWHTRRGKASGQCYQCQAKGWVSYRDDMRNESYRVWRQHHY